MAMTAYALRAEITTLIGLLDEHRSLWGRSLDRTMPTFPLKNQEELKRQSQELNRKLGRLRPYLDRLRNSWVMHHPGTGITWDGLEAAVGLSGVAQAKGPAMEAVLESLQQIEGYLEGLPPEELVLAVGEDFEAGLCVFFCSFAGSAQLS
jgi:hypothetical protein